MMGGAGPEAQETGTPSCLEGSGAVPKMTVAIAGLQVFAATDRIVAWL